MGELGVAAPAAGLRLLLGEPGGRALLEDALRGYLARQRWFGGKAREIREVALTGWVELGEGQSTSLGAIQVSDREEVITEHAVCFAVEDGEVVEGPGHETVARALVAAICRTRIEGERLAVVGSEREPEPVRSVRVLSAEQSNSSFICDDERIFKLYRRIAWGVNPEIEMAHALGSVGFGAMPRFLGAAWLERPDGAQSGLALMQEFKPGARDCWDEALDGIRAWVDSEDDAILSFLRSIGRTTAELHLALAHVDAADFRAQRATPVDIEAWVADTRAEASRAGGLEEAANGGSELEEVLRTCATAGVAALDGDAGLRIRIHGDYHLGQVLWVDGSLYVVDFEGEPAQPLEERRALRSPLMDVAGMTRSWAYACATVGRDAPDGDTLTRLWGLRTAGREAFLGAYEEEVARADIPLLPAEPGQRARLLALFELRKALYELVYEMNNRPDWAWIPAGAIPELLERATA